MHIFVKIYRSGVAASNILDIIYHIFVKRNTIFD